MGNASCDMSQEEKQKRVAYALNMCTISVSQIIDYNDIHILEQEYDAILNNLNLEEMPKDEALRDILKHLLDVITHFRIEEMEKRLVEREYQQKMKNAIWAAVPNFGMILAGGSVLTMALSLANQVGIGYMNYRRNKEEYGLERDRKMWELKRAAIEQFNYIRKELFDCAWKLAAAHGFPDAYRLTEKQIRQYNEILQDQNMYRKYERLETIKDHFEAYPPFWYFIGNVANFIANDRSLNLTEDGRGSFRKKALAYFEKFEKIQQTGILREDVLSASCALERIDLLLLEENADIEKINDLLDKAVRMAGSAFDILQLCAITYLRVGNVDSAAKILRNLVNEDYNKIINAQMLSAIYVHSAEKHRADYEMLATRVNPRYLFPMPQGKQDVRLLEAEFEAKRKEITKLELEITLDRFMQKCAVRWNSVLSTFEPDRPYPEDFFYENKSSERRRREEAERVFAIAQRTEEYRSSLKGCDFAGSLQNILNDMVKSLFSMELFSDPDMQKKMVEEIRVKILDMQKSIDKIQKALSDGTFQMSDYAESQRITLSGLTEGLIKGLKSNGRKAICASDAGDVAAIESDFLRFCTKEGLDPPELAVEANNGRENRSHPDDWFHSELFGHHGAVNRKNAAFLKDMADFVRRRMESINVCDGQAEILLRDDPKFEGYFQDEVFRKVPEIESHAVMVIQDKPQKSLLSFINFERGFDLIFTTDGIVVHKGDMNCLTPYSQAKMKNGKIYVYPIRYQHGSVDLRVLADLIKELGRKYARGLEEYVEYIPGTATIEILLDWFQQNKKAMEPGITRVIAIPDEENLKRLGYFIRSGLDADRNLMQCYYEDETGNVLGMRIVRCEGIDSNVQSLLLEKKGMLFVGTDRRK